MSEPSYCLLWIDRWWPWGDPWWGCLTTGSWAAWIQAVFSVVAIGASAYLMTRQHRMQIQSDRAREMEDVRWVADLLTLAAFKLKTLNEYLQSGQRFDVYRHEIYDHDHIDRMVEAIGALGQRDAPVGSLVLVLIGAQHAYASMWRNLGQHLGNKEMGIYDEQFDKLRKRAGEWHHAVQVAAESFNAYIERHSH
ncbi:MAG: hypothetical protein HY836_12130 [Aquabacterium sp.]|uniref:hypothetical protein n=1 Tax=Aquabacterium sp. TaxID=1872578 RepID=UPI0025BAA0FD|nr:hypothetical protein [Aquabacterium sp.]MBI5926337.1 hypothetical protein [Aquabacterium sp.]